MDEETQAITAAPVEAQAAPVDDASDIAATEQAQPEAPAVGADGGPVMAPDWSNADEVIAYRVKLANEEAARLEAEAPVETDPSATATDEQPAAAAQPSAPGAEAAPKPMQAQQDYTALIADLQARGFKVEPPAPPPDPFAELRNELAPYVGDERYEQLKQVALKPVPPEPAAYDQASLDAHEALVREVNDAKAELRQMDVNRRIHGASYAWARQKLLNDAGAELSGLAERYPGVDPARVGAVPGQPPKSLSDAVDAVAEAVAAKLNADWQQKYEQRERYWQGKVRQAESDASVARHRALGGAPAATSVPGGRAASPGRLQIPIGPNGIADPAWIQAAIDGKFANLDLSD